MADEKKKKLEVIADGKTKTITKDISPGMAIITNKDAITKNDDASATKIMSNKAVHATTTTCAVFSLLKEAGIPVAFNKQLSPTSFSAPECKMIPLEVVMRRYAVGSYLNRYPNLKKGKGEPPHRFHRLVFELFFKTTKGVIKDHEGNVIGKLPNDIFVTDREKPVDDPFLSNLGGTEWNFHHPKIPLWEEISYLGSGIGKQAVLPKHITVEMIEEFTRKVFLVLEGAWAKLNCRLIDFKIELGIGPNGELLVADVIDNDSWRLRTWDWKELSKQCFRDNADMSEISDKYALVANLVGKFDYPKQTIVFWRGSKDDKLPERRSFPGITLEDIVISGHKSPSVCLEKLEEILATYPGGGVIIPIVGMSNGLGPILSARTNWPVIAVPAKHGERPHDVWSSLEMPSNVPMVTVLSPKNAVLAALNILAQSNPIAYMHRQYAIEELDK